MRETAFCTLCGKAMDEFDENQNLTIHTRLGYGSVHDGDLVHIRLCCDCIDSLIDDCVLDPFEAE